MLPVDLLYNTSRFNDSIDSPMSLVANITMPLLIVGVMAAFSIIGFYILETWYQGQSHFAPHLADLLSVRALVRVVAGFTQFSIVY